MSDPKKNELEAQALAYHERLPRGKIKTELTKELESQHDLSLAYSPGVAAPCRLIHKDESCSFQYTGRANLVGVITNGSAVLGLGNIGAAAAKPVMEGKAMLFKKFANIDVFDIEINAADPDEFIRAVKALEPTFGGINLEDIKAPECFYIEETLREQMNIPVFHDDQHGTAIIAGSAFLNALEITDRKIEDVKIVFSGGGAAAIACAQLFLELGLKKENLIMFDSKGVIYKGREQGMNPYKQRFAADTKLRTLAEAMKGVDAFLGVSAPDVLTPEMIKPMNKNPIIFALANPDPEIHPDLVRDHRPDAIMATGRSDFPNQVNNVLGFPFIFRGALDVSATCVNEEMKRAAVKAIASLAKEVVPEEVSRIYSDVEGYSFGKDYLIPKPVDSRVLMHVAPAVAKAAMDSGVARKTIDIESYKEEIEKILGPTKKIVRGVRKQICARVLKHKKKPIIVLPHAADTRVLRAASQILSDGEIQLCLLGEKQSLVKKAQKLGLSGFERLAHCVDPLSDERMTAYADKLFELRQRKGVSRTGAYQLMRNQNYFASMMLKCGHVDGLVTGLSEPYGYAVRPILEVIGTKKRQSLAGIYMIVADDKLYFFADCTINITPTANELADIAISASDVAKRYTDDPIRVAMLSFASFGSSRSVENLTIAQAIKQLNERAPNLVVDGEMQADVALNEALQQKEFPFCRLNGSANVLIFPNLAAANISYKLITNIASRSSATGPLLVGVNKPANVLQRSAGVEEIVNMIYITAENTLVDVS